MRINRTKNWLLLTFTKIYLLIFLLNVIAFSQRQKADLIIVDANIHTVDPKRPKARSIAIKDGKIIAVEKKFGKIEKYRGKNTRQINGRSRLILPGFNDSHVHFMGIGNLFSSVNFKNVRDPKEITDSMAFYTRYLPKGRWILGGGWNHLEWNSKKLPTKALIDRYTREHPVLVYSSDPNVALANSLALRMANITRSKGDIENGEIVRDENGEPTGILKGDAILFVRAITPRTSTKQLLEVAETASNYAASLGVTSVQDVHSDYIAEPLRELHQQGKLKTRVYDCTPLYDWKKLADKGVKRATGDAMIRTGCLKGFSEGYPESFEQIYGYVSNADKNDLQVMIHAIGNRPNNAVLSMYEGVIRENGTKDRRFRIEHAYRFGANNLKRFSATNTIASLQPHLFGGGDPYRSIMKSRTKIAFGSDSSITDFNPILGIHAAVNSGREKISVKDAVRFYTLGSAFAEFQDDVKGSISVGKVADLVILSEDIFKIKPGKIRDVKVEMTIVDGKIVYNKRELTPLPNPSVRIIP